MTGGTIRHAFHGRVDFNISHIEYLTMHFVHRTGTLVDTIPISIHLKTRPDHGE